MSWRVDVQSKARHINQLNQPSAIVEMKLGSAHTDTVREIDPVILFNCYFSFCRYLMLFGLN